MFPDSNEHESDIRYDDKLQRRNRPIKRPKASRRRSMGKPISTATPGGIRQRRNRRWSW